MRNFGCLALTSLKIPCMRNWIWICFFFIGQIALAQNKITSIKMERTPCFGVCPAYTIEIKSNGVCVYMGIKDATYDGKIVGKLPNSEWKKLWKKYEKYNFLKLPSSYKVKASDFSKVHYTMIINGKTKTIRNANEGPEFLMELCQDLTVLHGSKIIWDKKSFVPNETKPVFRDYTPLDHGSDVSIGNQDVEQPQIVAPIPPQDEVFTVTEQMPEFPGGQEALMEFIRSNIRYPEQAKDLGIQGKVICSFVVDKSGEISKVNVLRGIGHGCDQEAVRVLRAMPKWKPGKQNGKAVNVKYNIPISFKLN